MLCLIIYVYEKKKKAERANKEALELKCVLFVFFAPHRVSFPPWSFLCCFVFLYFVVCCFCCCFLFFVDFFVICCFLSIYLFLFVVFCYSSSFLPSRYFLLSLLLFVSFHEINININQSSL